MTPQEFGLVLLSAVLHALWSVGIKSSRHPLGFNVLQVVPPIVAGLVALPWLHLGEWPRSLWWLLAGTAVAHAAYFYWMSRAYERADLSVVYPIARSTPAFLPLLAVPLMGESISTAGALGIATVVAGMWLVHTGGRLSWRALVAPGTRFAYLTLAATVAYSLLDKGAMARLGEAPWQAAVPRAIAWYLMLTLSSSLVFLALALPRLPRATLLRLVPSEGPAAVLASLVSFASYALILQALQSASVSYVVTVRQSSVLFAVAFAAVRLGERPGRPRAIGASLTVIGVALIWLSP